MHNWIRKQLSRRGLLSGGVVAVGGAMLAGLAGERHAAAQTPPTHTGHVGHGVTAPQHHGHGNMISVGDVDNKRNGFDPTAMLTDWERGTASRLPDGSTLRTSAWASTTWAFRLPR